MAVEHPDDRLEAGVERFPTLAGKTPGSLDDLEAVEADRWPDQFVEGLPDHDEGFAAHSISIVRGEHAALDRQQIIGLLFGKKSHIYKYHTSGSQRKSRLPLLAVVAVTSGFSVLFEHEPVELLGLDLSDQLFTLLSGSLVGYMLVLTPDGQVLFRRRLLALLDEVLSPILELLIIVRQECRVAARNRVPGVVERLRGLPVLLPPLGHGRLLSRYSRSAVSRSASLHRDAIASA